MQLFERSQGVRVPDGQLSSGKGEPKTVAHVVPMQPFAIEYCDEHGDKHATIAYKIGDVVYMDMNAERWAAGLRQASPFIKDAVERVASADTNAPVPEKDDVDIVSDKTDSDASDQATP